MPDDDDSPGGGLAALAAAAAGRYRTATDHVAEILKAAILDGTLAGGTPLRQEELAALFGVSRMPVREALRRLEAQALLDFTAHKGAVVTEISAADAADNYAVRRALEPAALILSIPDLTAADLARAAALIDEMEAANDGEDGRTGELNRRFHMTLYGRAGRPRLLALTEQQLAAADRYVRFHLAAKGREHLSQGEHRALLAAAGRRDVDAAVAVLHAHLDTAAATIAAFFRDRAGR